MMKSLWRAAICALLLGAAEGNMNGKPGQYKIANGNPASPKAYSTDYNAEYFDVYGPTIKTRYSEVYWKMQEAVPIPEAIRKRFHNKTMAIVGYEVDQVQVTPQGDVPVPITWAYNHHYECWMLNSKKARMVKAKSDARAIRLGLNHGAMEHWKPEILDPSDDSEIPLTQFFSEGNGGEFRLSYHGYPKGYAQFIESPDIVHVMPMQIDTRNRDMDTPAFKPGPLPRASRIPASAGYSGLIECPCSDTLPKKWGMSYGARSTGRCRTPVKNATECFSGARQVMGSSKYVEHQVSASSKAGGCSVERHVDGTADIFWNSAVGRGCASRRPADSLMVSFAQSVVNLTVALATQEAPTAATITITGPADRWFGVGFGADAMCVHMVSDECPEGGPYAIVVSGESVTERKLAFHGAGDVLPRSVTVQSSTVQNGYRTVVLTRPLSGASPKHYTFDPTKPSMPIINAKGCGLPFAQHCGHAPATLTFFATNTPTCVCEGGIRGTIGGNPFPNPGPCSPQPHGDLLWQHNPTCSVQTYVGGLRCCRDGKSLLDADQPVPWPDQYLEYSLKFRFYFEEYVPARPAYVPSHQNLVRLYWTTEAFAGEYDVPQCLPGTPAADCIHVITSRWKVREMMHNCSLRTGDGSCTGTGSTDPNQTAGVKLIYAGPHCHAPTCLSMELYNADTGRLLCHMEPVRGQSVDLYDEHGFLAIPPCLWGDIAEGLLEPELLSLDTTLLSIKRNNNTLGHTGEMASWQMRGIVVPRHPKTPAREGVLAPGKGPVGMDVVE